MWAVRWRGGVLEVVDQRRLPARRVIRRCRRVEEVAEAIETLQVRGAPAIGIAAAYGVVLGVRPELGRRMHGHVAFRRQLDAAIARLGRTRPTAVNLRWALDRMRRVVTAHPGGGVRRWRQRLLAEARAIHAEDRRRCAAIGAAGAALLTSGDTVMTHCNTGGLATGGLGTAFAVFATAHAQRKHIHVIACEARPVWQGARLTMWELQQYGIPATLICDTAAASLMARRPIAAVIVGADRIAANGDTANKIGTYGLALLARAHRIPFYVAAPTSTIDLATPSGAAIPIEERPPAEVTRPYGLPIAPRSAHALNPAFDVTPRALISGIITEHGVLKPPYAEKLRRLKANPPHLAPLLPPREERLSEVGVVG
ncbi:MAG: S-methyl-5-thioribose-1-phosphate isomerase [Candidatus Omnitrophica bacterium]|nr:S-methyl-5-thioribose-1-phosphate isomerase [Candidatus Omnitrophota bacterium]